MDSAGIFSGNTVDIQSVRLEPYVLGSNFADRVLLVGEVRYLLDFCPHLSNCAYEAFSSSDSLVGLARQIFR
jgi:hypothetical protein